MIRPRFIAMLCVAGCVASISCTMFNKYGATSLDGKPDSTGFVVVDSRVDVLAAIFNLHTPGTASGGRLERVDGEKETAEGGMALEMLVFSGLHPGRWRLVEIEADWAAGPAPAHQAFPIPPELAQEFTFDVRAGKPVYLGVVNIENDRREATLGVRFDLKPDPASEKKVWEKLVEIYGNGAWGPALRAKL